MISGCITNTSNTLCLKTINLLSLQVLQVRNSGAAQPGAFSGVGSGSAFRLAGAGPARGSEQLGAGRHLFLCRFCGFPCGLSMWTSLSFLSAWRPWTFSLATWGSKGECPERDKQKLHGLYKPHLGGHRAALLLHSVQPCLPTFKRKEHRLCYLVRGVARFWKSMQHSKGCYSYFWKILFAIMYITSFPVGFPISLSSYLQSSAVWEECPPVRCPQSIRQLRMIWVYTDPLLFSPTPAQPLEVSFSIVKLVNPCCFSRSCSHRGL